MKMIYEKSGVKILVVDDEMARAAELELCLQEFGYTVCGKADSAEQALGLIGRDRPDLVLMALGQKGEMRGIKIAEIIRIRCGIPVVFGVDPADADRLKTAGATYAFGYLIKPFEEKELKLAIEMALTTAEAFREVEARYEALLGTTGEGIILLAASGEVLIWNKGAEDIFKIPAQDVLGRTLSSIKGRSIGENGSIRDGLESLGRKTQQTGVPDRNKILGIYQPSGELRWISVNTNPIGKGDKTPPFETAIAIRDITGLKKNLEALKSEQFKLKEYFEDLQIMAYNVTFEGIIADCNEAVIRTLGYDDKRELVGRPFLTTIYAPASREKAKKLFEKWKKKNRIADEELQIITKHGEVIDVLLNVNTIYDHHGIPLYSLSTHLDITRHKRLQTELLEKTLFLDRVFDQSPFAIWISDAKGTLLWANPALKKFLNLTDDQLVGKYNVLEDPLVEKQGLMPLIHSVYEEGKSIHFACDWDGDDIPTLNLEGSNSVSIEATLFPIQNSDGEIINAVMNWIDVTDRKLMEEEKRKLEHQLNQAQKLETIGVLAGGIAHDFNNILSAIIGYIQLSIFDIGDEKEVRYNLEQALTASRRGKNLVEQMLSFSRQANMEFKPVNLAAVVRETIDFIRAGTPTTIEIKSDVPETSRLALANETQLQQVLVNLCHNAAQAMPNDKGTIEISLKEIQLETNNEPDLKPGSYHVLTVSDNGQGIRKEDINKIFDPFFSTKGPGEGTGMGLSVVFGIVRKHGGGIKVHSELNKGTVFHVYLPAGFEEVVDETIMDLPLPGGSERILYVDDEKSLVEVAQKLLTRLGYQVTVATSSIKALDEIKQNGYQYDLVITDQTMPEMTGVELSKAIMSLYPKLPIILCTGFSASIDAERASELGIRTFLMKPLDSKNLALTVRSVLDGAP